MELFYVEIGSSEVNNGWSSDFFFTLGRGVRQGCPLSPYMFIFCAVILASAIRRNPDMKGIPIDGEETKISLFADDTTLI